MAIDTTPLDAQCIFGSEEPMDIDHWEVNVAFQPDEATILTSVMAMDWEADVLTVLGDWSGTRVPSIPSPISMVVDQLHPSSPPSPTQLAPTNPTLEDGNLINRVHCAPSPTHLVAEQVPPSPSTLHLAPPAPTMLGSVSPTPSSSLPVIPSSEGIESAGTDEPAEVQRQTLEVPAEQPDTQLLSLVEQSTDTPSLSDTPHPSLAEQNTDTPLPSLAEQSTDTPSVSDTPLSSLADLTLETPPPSDTPTSPSLAEQNTDTPLPSLVEQSTDTPSVSDTTLPSLAEQSADAPSVPDTQELSLAELSLNTDIQNPSLAECSKNTSVPTDAQRPSLESKDDNNSCKRRCQDSDNEDEGTSSEQRQTAPVKRRRPSTLVLDDKAADDFVRKLALKNAPVFADLADPSAPLLSFTSSRAHAEATSAQPVPTSLAEMFRQDGIPVLSQEPQQSGESGLHSAESDDEFEAFAAGVGHLELG
ncbi:hypothetical protein Unana1_00498 [Umbelopsis nana]